MNGLAMRLNNNYCGRYFMWLILGTAFLVVYLPVIVSLIHVWAHSDDSSHGFIIIPLAVYMLWLKRSVLCNEPIRGSWHGLPVVALSLIAFTIAKMAEIQSLAPVSMIIFLCGSVIFLFGYGIFRLCLFPLMMLFFMIPVPSQIMAALTIPLQLIVTKASVSLASAVGVPIINEGNVIYLPEGTFQVVEACSGLRSIMTLLTLGAVLAYMTLRSNILRGALFLLAVPIAIAVNILRVFVLVVAFHSMGVDLSEGTPHTLLGLALFGVAFGLFLAARKGLAICER